MDKGLLSLPNSCTGNIYSIHYICVANLHQLREEKTKKENQQLKQKILPSTVVIVIVVVFVNAHYCCCCYLHVNRIYFSGGPFIFGFHAQKSTKKKNCKPNFWQVNRVQKARKVYACMVFHICDIHFSRHFLY